MFIISQQQKQRLSGRGDKVGVSQVEEESEGWYRLRTVANQWSSDEDMPRRAQDLRHKLVSRGREGLFTHIDRSLYSSQKSVGVQ